MKRVVFLTFLVTIASINLLWSNQYAAATNCQSGTSLLINGGFEQPSIGLYGTPLGSQVDGWETLDSMNQIEIFGTGVDHSTTPGTDGPYTSAEGTQFIEVVANSLAPVYQDFTTVPGSTLSVSLKQQARYQGSASQVLLQIGTPNGPYSNLGLSSATSAVWESSTFSYEVPSGQTTTRLLIEADIAAGTINSPQSVGSPLVDDVSVNVVSCPTEILQETTSPQLASTGTPQIMSSLLTGFVFTALGLFMFYRMKS
jgi:hypothetical protein